MKKIITTDAIKILKDRRSKYPELARLVDEELLKYAEEITFDYDKELHLGGYEWSWRVVGVDGETIHNYTDEINGNVITLEEATEAVREHNEKLAIKEK